MIVVQAVKNILIYALQGVRWIVLILLLFVLRLFLEERILPQLSLECLMITVLPFWTQNLPILFLMMHLTLNFILQLFLFLYLLF